MQAGVSREKIVATGGRGVIIRLSRGETTMVRGFLGGLLGRRRWRWVFLPGELAVLGRRFRMYVDVNYFRKRIEEYDEAWKQWTEDEDGVLMLMHGQVVATK